MAPILYFVIPCYNEEEVLPITSEMFLKELDLLVSKNKISSLSRILFVDDGSNDSTWDIISELANQNTKFIGIRQSRNRGHQSSLMAGMDEAVKTADIVITVDCDGQDDITASEKMVDEYLSGAEIVYGVRSDRKSDTYFKRGTAEKYYKILKLFGVDIVYNHADYRLVSSKVLNAFADFGEVNLFLRGMFPLVGFKSTVVTYGRKKRAAGKSHYSFYKMLSLAIDGITSLSIKPIRMITAFGFLSAFLSFLGIIWSVVRYFTGGTVSGWASMICAICFFSGILLIGIGILGEYIGKIYLEVKHRPRYIISEKTEVNNSLEDKEKNNK